MKIEKLLQDRSGNQCEICKDTRELDVYTVSPKTGDAPGECAYLCSSCRVLLDTKEKTDSNRWKILSETMWSEHPPVQVLAYRILSQLSSEGWPVDLLDMLYLDEETMNWAKTGMTSSSESGILHKDSNGAILQAGDSVVLIKDLNVKGANFTAKRGTAVRNISLDSTNEKYIEGRVNGQQIVIITDFVKKT